ncbi:MAG: GTPase HflX [Clostridiaceae bacterium]
MIYTQLDSIKKSILDELEKLYDESSDNSFLFSPNLIQKIMEISLKTNKEISVCIDRKGKILAISIGESNNVEIPLEKEEGKYSKVRIIHTHPNGDYNLSAVDISALTSLKLDTIASVSMDNGEIKGVLAYLNVKDGRIYPEISNPLSLEELINFNLWDKLKEIERPDELPYDNEDRAILVSIQGEESIDELIELAKACEINPVRTITQNRDKIDKSFYIGRGKAEEISYCRQIDDANLIIFDDELTGAVVRNLEDLIGAHVIDRTTLILEIFARRAKTKEAKVQVELAQLKYRLPRLQGLGEGMSRTGGGIGTRGPGEKKLETDRRHIRERIYDLKEELLKITKTREVQRRKRNDLPKISLVGYTNAGKSTLRNKMCELYAEESLKDKTEVFTKDMLFATLDTTTRVIKINEYIDAALTDTVGFISRLPHDLVESFKSTLEEARGSDILIHVIDGKSSNIKEHINSVYNVLEELNISDKPIIEVVNKIDLLSGEEIKQVEDALDGRDYIKISAKNGINLDLLVKNISEKLLIKEKKENFLIPYDQQGLISYLHDNGKIISMEYKEDGTLICAVVEEKIYNKMKKYIYN